MFISVPLLLFLFSFVFLGLGILITLLINNWKQKPKSNYLEQEGKTPKNQRETPKNQWDDEEVAYVTDKEEDEEDEEKKLYILAHELKSGEYQDLNLILSRFSGRDAEKYTPEEVEEFRDILYKLNERDVAGWVDNLHAKGIALPNSLKEEVFFIGRNWRS